MSREDVSYGQVGSSSHSSRSSVGSGPQSVGPGAGGGGPFWKPHSTRAITSVSVAFDPLSSTSAASEQGGAGPSTNTHSRSAIASISSEMLAHPANPLGKIGFGPMVANALDVFAHATAHYSKPAFDINEVDVDGTAYPVIEATVMNRPFGDLKRFRLDGVDDQRPKMLIVAPMSGHYATLLRGTVRRMLQKFEVYITDWADAKMVPQSEGFFDLDTYIDYLTPYRQ